MKKFIIILIVGLCFSCGNSSKKENSSQSTVIASKENEFKISDEELEKSKDEYLLIKHNVENEYFPVIDGQIENFLKNRKSPVYTDSVLQIKKNLIPLIYRAIKHQFETGHYNSLENIIKGFLQYRGQNYYTDSVILYKNEIVKNRNKNKRIRDSLSQISFEKYLTYLDLPFIDSINSNSFKGLWSRNYKLDFCKYDSLLFKTNWDENWYLGKVYLDSVLCIATCHFRDCENSIMLNVFDSTYQIKARMEIYTNGCYVEPAPDFPFGKYIINENGKFNASYILGDSAIIRIDRTFFTLKDTLTGEVKKEIGDEYNVTYKIDSNFRFKIIDNQSFKKDYVEPLYKVPI
jgi:hypothetical protein